MNKDWRDVAGYEGLYQVNELGEVRSLAHSVIGSYGKLHPYPGKVLKPTKDRKGYLYVDLSKQGKRQKYKVHRLVATAFIPNPHNYPQVNHIDHVVDNNNVDNLEWCTDEYNQAHKARQGRCCKKQVSVV